MRFRPLGPALEAPCQGIAGLHVELVHQRRPPAVPQRRFRGRDVRDGEGIEVVETGRGPHVARELVDDRGVVDVLVLRGGGHDQVRTHEPLDQFGLLLGQSVPPAERNGIVGAENGVVAAASLADVMEQSGDVKQLYLGNVLDAAHGEGELLGARRIAEPPHVADDHHGVRIDRVDVEQVVLHLSHDASELGDVPAKNAVAPHAGELAYHGVGCPQQFHEVPRHLGVAPEVVVDQLEVIPDEPDRRGAYANDVAPVRHDDEQLEQCRRVIAEHGGRGRFHVPVVHLEARVDGLDARRSPAMQDGLVEVLQQDVVHLPQFEDVAVVVVHELLDSQLRVGVAVAEALGEGTLVVEQEPVLLAGRDQVQPETDAAQELAALREPAPLLGREIALARELGEVGGAEMPARDPADGLDVPQTPGRPLDVRFQVVLDVVELGVPVGLLDALGLEEPAARPDKPALEGPVEPGAEDVGAGQAPPFDQRRGHGDVARCLPAALPHGPYAVADVELEVPEQADEGGDVVRVAARVADQDQQVDVGARMEFAASVAADGEQCHVVAVLEGVLPDLDQERIEEARALRDQDLGVFAAPEAVDEPAVREVDATPELSGVERPVQCGALMPRPVQAPSLPRGASGPRPPRP